MYIAISINLIIAGIMIIALLGDINFLILVIYIWPLNLGIGIFALYFSGNVIGNKMEYLIVQRKWNSVLTGIVGLLLVLLIGVLAGSTVGFLQEGIKYGFKYAYFTKYIDPLYWIFPFGFIPTIIAGGITGYRIKKMWYNNE